MDMNQKFQHLTQGSKLVEEYYKEIVVTMIRAMVYKNPEATMISS